MVYLQNRKCSSAVRFSGLCQHRGRQRSSWTTWLKGMNFLLLLAALLFLLFCFWSIFTPWENAINRPIQLLSSLWYIKGNSVVLGLLQWILRVICCLIDLPENRKQHSRRVFLLFTFPLWQSCCWSWQQVHIAGLLSGDMDCLGKVGEKWALREQGVTVQFSRQRSEGALRTVVLCLAGSSRKCWNSSVTVGNYLLQAAKLL